jgi:hypothetical protein
MAESIAKQGILIQTKTLIGVSICSRQRWQNSNSIFFRLMLHLKEGFGGAGYIVIWIGPE